MSNTMNRDADFDKIARDIYFKENNILHAEVERLRAENKHLHVLCYNLGETQNALTTENDSLRARVEEVERLKSQRDDQCRELMYNVQDLKSALLIVQKYQNDMEVTQARIEELETELQRAMDLWTMLNKERDELRMRVEELVKNCNEIIDERDNLRQVLDKEIELVNELREKLSRSATAYWALEGKVKELSEQLATADEACENWAKSYRELATKLQPAKPSVVRSTWRNLYTDAHVGHPKRSKDECLDFVATDRKHSGFLRHDHMSDGTVVVTLETL